MPRPTELSVVFLAVCLSAAPAAVTATELLRGPVLSQPTTDGVVVTFELDAPAVPTVRWGEGGELDASWTADGSGDAFEVALTGLPSGATVDYRIYDGDTPISEAASIPTAVEPGVPFSFIVFGDTRSRADVHAAIVAQMDAVPGIRWYVQTGDLVSDGEVLDQWDEYFEIERAMMATTPLFPTIGNHDEHDGDASNYVNLFANPENSPQPEHFYSFDYGNVHGVVLDGHVNAMTWLECLPVRDMLIDDCFTEEQEAWLIADLEAAAVDPDIDHILVFTHIGPFSSKDGRSGSAQMRLLLPTFWELGVTAIFSGHDHYYERGTSGNGIPYVITGGGGAPLYDIADPSSAPHEVVTNASIEHWVEVDVDGTTMTVTTVTLAGDTLDTFTVEATEECQVDEDCADTPPDVPCDAFETRCSLGGRCIADCVEAGEDVGDFDEDVGGPDTDAAVTPDTSAPPDASASDVSTVPDTADRDDTPSDGTGRRRGCSVAPVAPSLAPALLVGLAVLLSRRRGRIA